MGIAVARGLVQPLANRIRRRKDALICRACLTKEAGSLRSDLEINRMTSLIFAPNLLCDAQPDRTIHALTSSPSTKQMPSDLPYRSVPVMSHSQSCPLSA